MMRRLALCLAVALAALSPMPVFAQVATIGPLAFSTTVNGVVATIPLNGQATCTVNVYAIAGSTITPQSSSDGSTYVTATGMNAGTINANGTFTGVVATTGLTQFRLTATGVTGTLSGAVTCAPQSVIVSNTPAGGAAITGPLAASGAVQTTVCDQTTAGRCTLVTVALADGVNSSPNGLNTVDYNLAFNGTAWDRMRKDPFAAGPLWVSAGGGTNTAIAGATAGPTVIKGSPGRLVSVLATTLGATTSVTLFDNASACSGTIIAILPITIALGTETKIDRPAAAGITACGGTGSAAVTVTFW